jgi:hypothetical protein
MPAVRDELNARANTIGLTVYSCDFGKEKGYQFCVQDEDSGLVEVSTMMHIRDAKKWLDGYVAGVTQMKEKANLSFA